MSTRFYDTDLTDAAWAFVAPVLRSACGRSAAWRIERVVSDYEYRVQTSETMIDLASIRLMLNRIAPV